MEEAYEFLKKCGVFYIATIDENKPRVRPFGAVNIFDNKLYFQTGKSKNVFKQIEKNPYVEISGMYDGKWIRLEGKLIEDNRIEAKKSMLDNNSELRSMYSENDDNTKVLYMTDAKADICSFVEPKKEIKF